MAILNNRHKRLVFKALDHFGLRLYVAGEGRPIDLTELEWEHPLEALYHANDHRSVLIKVPIESLRTMGPHAFVPVVGGNSPFVQATVDYINGTCTTYEGSALEYFYATCQPKNAAELLRLSEPDLPAWMPEMPPEAAILPWQTETPESLATSLLNGAILEAKQHKAKFDNLAGMSHWGPVSKGKGKLEFKRLANLVLSINERGLIHNRYDADNLKGLILANGENYSFYLTNGQHRVAVASALGFKSVVVQIPLGPAIDRKQLKYCPAVRNGYYNNNSALALFDRITTNTDSPTQPC